MLDFIAVELREAAMPLDSSRPGLQFLINSSMLGSTYRNRDAIFWQAPIAMEESTGDLVGVGYFVRWDGNSASLCRFLVNPGNANDLISI